MSAERQSRAYAIVQELRLLGGFAEFTFDEATADNLRSAKTPSSGSLAMFMAILPAAP